MQNTSIGQIPADWSVEPIGDLFSVSAGGDWDAEHSVKVQDAAHPFPVIANALTPGATQGYCSYFTIPGDTISITGRGDVGRAVYRPTPFVPIVRLLALVPTRPVSARFFAEYINSRVRFSLESTGVPQLTAPQVRPYLLAVPPVEEQREIASVLSDIDGLISTLESSIAKKRAIKQGMMQQLLTGRIRLPGYFQDWLRVEAGEIGAFKGGNGFSPRFQGEKAGAVPFYKVSDMNNEGNEFFMQTANNYVSDAGRKHMGAVLMPARAIVFAKVGAAIFLERKRLLSTPSCIDNNMAAFIVDPSRADVRFIYYVLSSFPMSSLVATGALPSLNGRQLRTIPIFLPSDMEEQRAIASVLADVDAEINVLNARLAKAQDIKIGMMQELLTGRTRLPVTEAAS